MSNDLFSRSKANPIIKPTDLPFNVNGVLNPGVALVDDEVVLLLRIENRRGISGLYVARSKNGVDGWRIEPQALLEPVHQSADRGRMVGCVDRPGHVVGLA